MDQFRRLKRSYRIASIISSDRVAFNIKGNDYRLVAAIEYRRKSFSSNGSARTAPTTASTQELSSMEIKPVMRLSLAQTIAGVHKEALHKCCGSCINN
jgi:hypothetical protein